MPAILNFGTNANIRETILTYDSSGKLLKSWDPAPQCVEAIAYSKDDDAVFILGERSLPDGPYAPNYPLLVEYSRDGNVQKVMIPAGAVPRMAEISFHQGRPIWRNDATRHERSSLFLRSHESRSRHYRPRRGRSRRSQHKRQN